METSTPTGRLVQGKFAMQQKKDMETGQLMINKDGTPTMEIFTALAFPKILPNGAPNIEWAKLWSEMVAVAAAAWPTFFPQGPQPLLANGGCTNPKFSWKVQDGDGVDSNGKSVAEKAGFKGNYVLSLKTAYNVRVHHDGKFAAHEEIQQPDEIVKRGYWMWAGVEIKGNEAVLEKLQVPGIVVYPKFFAFVERGEEIIGGPDIAAIAAKRNPGAWRPEATNSPIGASGLPASPSIAIPGAPLVPPAALAPPQLLPPAVPVFVLSPALAAAGHTVASMAASGWTEAAMVAAGHGTMSTPAPAPLAPPPLAAPVVPPPPAAPKHPVVLIGQALATGATIESMLALGWTYETLISTGNAQRI